MVVGRMELLEKYKEYREIQIRLHSKILDTCVRADDFNKSTEIMGIVKNSEIVLESNYEKDVILDFNLYEKIKNGKNSVSEYIELEVETTPREEELLTAMKKSSTGLYEVVECEKEKGIVILKDVSNGSNDVIKVIDMGLSGSLNKNILVFTRLLHLDEITMTSGLGFIFTANHKQYLLKRSRKFMKKIDSGDASADRFIAFFQLNRSDGVPTVFQKINE
jgi:hypothetical protein